MAYQETLRPDGDSSPLEWLTTEGTHYEAICQDVGAIGAITSIDTARIASWNGSIAARSPSGEITDRVTWSNWTGPANTYIDLLTFRYAGYTNDIYGDTITVNVYIDGALAETTTFSLANREALDLYIVSSVEVPLTSFITPTQLNTMETEFVTDPDGLTILYAVECVVETSEKKPDDSLPLECKKIEVEDGTTEKLI